MNASGLRKVKDFPHKHSGHHLATLVKKLEHMASGQRYLGNLEQAPFTFSSNKQNGVSEHTEKVWEKKRKHGYYDHEKRRDDSLAQISYIQPKLVPQERENKPNFTCFL